MKINILKLTLLILSSTFLISCGSTKQLFDYGSVKTSNQIETIKISNINNLPICKVLIGEKEYNFLIDTGAPTVIPNEIFQRLKLKSFFTEEITDANNKKRKQNFTILPEIKIDNLIFKEIGCVVMDIETPALKCFGFDGIIGANLLAKMVWQFDFSKNESRASCSGLKSMTQSLKSGLLIFIKLSSYSFKKSSKNKATPFSVFFGAM